MMRCVGARQRRDGIPRCDVTWAGTGACPYEIGADRGGGHGGPAPTTLRGLLISACGLGGALLVAEGTYARGETEQANEAGGVALLVDVVLAEGDETLVVQGVGALAAGDDGVALVEAERDRTGYGFLRHVDERVVRFALDRPPASFVHQVGVARGDEVLGCESATIERELLELAVRCVEQSTTRRLVDAARLHADETILDQIDAANAVASADLVQSGEKGHWRHRVPIDRDRSSALEGDRHFFGDVGRGLGRL